MITCPQICWTFSLKIPNLTTALKAQRRRLFDVFLLDHHRKTKSTLDPVVTPIQTRRGAAPHSAMSS